MCGFALLECVAHGLHGAHGFFNLIGCESYTNLQTN